MNEATAQYDMHSFAMTVCIHTVDYKIIIASTRLSASSSRLDGPESSLLYMYGDGRALSESVCYLRLNSTILCAFVMVLFE